MVIKKNKVETKQRLIHAVGEILAETGFNNVGVNAVARKAGVDKVLIYRYFNDMDGLIKEYAKSASFWPTLEELIGSGTELIELQEEPFDIQINTIFERYAYALRNRPLTLEILAWETIERNSLTIELEKVRESMAETLSAKLNHSRMPDGDWQAITSIFSASIHYLAIRARHIKTYNGLDLSSDQDWKRLIDAMHLLTTRMTN